jgi:hypothetical protein
MKPIEVLKGARALISSPESWVKKAFRVRSEGVCSYCALGAIEEVSGCSPERARSIESRALYNATVDELSGSRGEDYVVTFNDAPATTHADVLKMFDDRISALEAAGE